MEISSPNIKNAALPAAYTCDGRNVPPTLRWTKLPRGTAELMLDIIKAHDVNEKIYFDWAVAHIKPTVHGITAGKLPPGAVLGANSKGHVGYDLCPPKGTFETYIVLLFALPHRLSAKTGFDAGDLRHQALHTGIAQNNYLFQYTRPK